MRSKIIDKIRQRTSQESRDEVERQMAEPFSPFGRILPEEWWFWDQKNWPEDEYVGYAASEAWNVDEYTDQGYIAMKRMLYELVNPNNEEMDLEIFEQRLKELYEHRKNNR